MIESLPLSLGMVGTDLSQLTMRALGAGARVAGGDQKTRAVERFEDVAFGDLVFLADLVFGGNSVLLYVVGGSRAYSAGPELNAPPAKPFPVDLRDTATPRAVPRVHFDQLAMGSSNPPFIL